MNCTDQAIALLRPSATASTKQVTALPGFRPKTPSLLTLGRAINLGELLAVFRARTPATSFTTLVAFALSFRLGKVVRVDGSGVASVENLRPVDCPHVAEAEVVEYSDVSVQNRCEQNKNARCIETIQ